MSVVVTGASGAIGAAIVRSFASEGLTVVAQDIRRGTHGPNVTEIVGDLRDLACLEDIARTAISTDATAVIAAHGTLRGSGPLADLQPELIRELMDINFGVIPNLFEVTKDALRASSGVFIVVASQAALRGEPAHSTYCASKWAVRAWAEAADRAARGDGVRVRAICPGRIESPLLDRALDMFASAEGVSRADYEERVRDLIPAGRFGQPEEIAAAVRYLSNATARPTVIAVNGAEVPW